MTTVDSQAKIAASSACPDTGTEPVSDAVPDLGLDPDEADAFMRAIGQPFQVPLHQLRLPPNIPAGFSPLRLYAIADALRNRGGDVLDPVHVRRLGEQDWLVVEGRHRVLGSWVAGCPSVLCVEVL